MPDLRPDSPLQYIQGIGPQRAAWFKELGLDTVADLLEYFPFRHEFDQGVVEIADLQPGNPATIRGEIIAAKLPGRRGQQMLLTVHDGSASCTLRWFTAPHYDNRLRRGAMIIASGPVRDYAGKAEMIQPRIRVAEPDTPLVELSEGKLVGIYHATEKLKTWTIRQTVERVLAQSDLLVEEILPAGLRQKRRLPTREAAIRGIHQPQDERALKLARRRLAYEEFLLLQLAMAIRRRRITGFQSARKLPVTAEIDRRIRARFPFPLTAAQDEVLREIRRDLQSGHPMTRLLQGDVGSGKTVVALYACLAAVAHRRQAAIMAPTEILAEQHFANIEKYLAGSRVRRALLTGSRSPLERRAALAAIEAGDLDLVVGTQALIQQNVAFKDLALIVVDEQHKFGVLQRAAFRTKGPAPHYLVMTATPIPRTLAMTVFGDLDVSIIKQSPPGRGRITTRIVIPQQFDQILLELRRRVESGEQAYVVCPQIGSDETIADDLIPNPQSPMQNPQSAIRNPQSLGDPKSKIQNPNSEIQTAEQTYAIFKNKSDATLRPALLHGGLKSAAKQAVLDAFRSGASNVLVATTVVEVGVDVPSATVMLIENADRFGLSQLHQLRGRIGRGPRDSLCLLMARSQGTNARERLAVMTQTADGFRIAEADLRQRGPGELVGTRQHGLPELKVGDLVADFALLQEARDDAFALIESDPQLRQRDHAPLAAALRRMFKNLLTLIDAA